MGEEIKYLLFVSKMILLIIKFGKNWKLSVMDHIITIKRK